MPIAGAESGRRMDIGLACMRLTVKSSRDAGKVWKDLSTQEVTGSWLIGEKKLH